MRLYGTEWKDDASPLAIEFKCIRKGGTWVDDDGYVCGLGMAEHYRNAMRLMWPEDDEHRWETLIHTRLAEKDIVTIMGASDCVSGDTRILDPVTGENPTIESLCSDGRRPHVMTLSGPELASVPYFKGMDWLYEVTCENGKKFTATSRHRVLTREGFVYVEDLRIGQRLLAYDEGHPLSNEVFSQEAQRQGACCSRNRSRDFRGDYHHGSCSYGAQLLTAEGDGLEPFPSQACVPKHIPGSFDQDGLGNELERSCFESPIFLQSNARSMLLDGSSGIPSSLHSLRETPSPLSLSSRQPFQLLSDYSLHGPSSLRGRNFESTLSEIWISLRNTVHPTVVISTRKIRFDSFFDLTVPKAGHYFAEGFIHHNSSKTYSVAKYVLCDWWVDPLRRLWLVSSTDKRGAELRVWGKLKEFFNRARKRFPWLPGKVLESKSCITPSEISDDGGEGRLLTQGIIFVPTRSGATWLGLGPWIGVKPPSGGKLGHAGDEAQLMQHSFLDAYANWYGKENFQGILTGNPADLEDPLCTAAEPEDGWDSWKDSGKTQEWKSKFYGAHVICLDGRDTPNNDHPYIGGKPRYSYLIGKKKIDSVKNLYGENDWHFWHQCVGKPQTSVQARRVLTRASVEHNNAYEEPVWMDNKRTKLCSLDAAYGGVGGDRCVINSAEFGKEVSGKTILAPDKWELIPISVEKSADSPEMQIAQFCKSYCEARGIEPSNFFFDARGTLAVALARVWSPDVNVVDFGGVPSDRPVSNDEYVWDGDNAKRLKTCSEHYFNFVTELWFSFHYAVIGGQIRSLDREVAREFFRRTWNLVGKNKIQVEPKREMKERTLQSPDLADANVILLEGARRLGFEIGSSRSLHLVTSEDYLLRELAKFEKMRKASSLKYDTAH